MFQKVLLFSFKYVRAPWQKTLNIKSVQEPIFRTNIFNQWLIEFCFVRLLLKYIDFCVLIRISNKLVKYICICGMIFIFIFSMPHENSHQNYLNSLRKINICLCEVYIVYNFLLKFQKILSNVRRHIRPWKSELKYASYTSTKMFSIA